MRVLSYVLLLIGLDLFVEGSSPAHAEPSELRPEIGYHRGVIESARTAAMGGALRAFSSSVEALHSNPANMALSRVYHVGGFAQIWPQAERRTLGVAIVDSLSSQSRLAGGLSVSWLTQDPDGLDRAAREYRAGLALPLTSAVSLGVAGRYIDLTQDGSPSTVLPASLASGGLREASVLKELTLDVGLSLHPVEGFRIALVGNNLSDSNHSLLPLLLGGGIGIGQRLFTAEVDLSYDLTTYEEPTAVVGGGVEFLAANRFPLRLGYRWDEGEEIQALSVGAGYVSREFALDLAFRRSMVGEENSSFMIDFKYHVEARGM